MPLRVCPDRNQDASVQKLMIIFQYGVSTEARRWGKRIILRRCKIRACVINHLPHAVQNKKVNLRTGITTQAVKSILIIRRGGRRQ